jgi:hypothetical protein
MLQTGSFLVILQQNHGKHQPCRDFCSKLMKKKNVAIHLGYYPPDFSPLDSFLIKSKYSM